MNTPWLIPVDGSQPSLNAVDYVIREAANHTEPPQIFLVNVQTALSSDITRFINGRTIEDFHREEGNAALASAKEKLEAAQLSFSSHILIGETANSLVDFAKKKTCSLIIMGTHGFNSVVGLLMGSVTVKVVHLSPIPVLLVK